MNIRIATIADAKDILEIYAPYITDTAITFEYEIPSYHEFEQRIQTILEKYPYYVALMDEKIVGYAYVSSFKGRKAYDWSVETSIYVDRNYQHQGIGKALYEKLEQTCKEMNITNLNACIATIDQEDEYLNNSSIYFHEKLGYDMVGTFHQCAYKFNRWYNMCWMEKSIAQHTQALPVIPFKQMKGI